MATKAEPKVWDVVAQAVNDRLAELGWDQVDLARAAGVSDATVRKLQHASASRYHRTTLTKVARALGWPADGVWQIIATGEVPDQVVSPGPVERGDDDDELLEELASMRQQLAAMERRLRQR